LTRQRPRIPRGPQDQDVELFVDCWRVHFRLPGKTSAVVHRASRLSPRIRGKGRDSSSLDFLRRQKQPRIARGHQCAPAGERLEKELVCDERGLVSERGVAGASTRTATLTTMIRGMMQVNSEPTER